MKDGLLIFREQLDQTKNLRAPTDKKILQRDLVKLKKDGYVYLDRIQDKKLELLDFDKCLQKLNPHEHKQTEQLNKHILQVQILGNIKQPEELDKLEQYLKQKETQKYEEQIQQMTQGNQFQQKHPLFFDGKRRLENLQLPEEKAYVRIHRLGAVLSSMKQNPKFVYNPEQNQSIQEIDTNQQSSIQTEKRQETRQEESIPKFQAQIQEQEPELSQEFLTVFKNDTTLNKEKLKQLFPKVDFENIKQEKKQDTSQLQVDQPQSSIIAPLKINKVKFNPVAKEIYYEVDDIKENNQNSVFQRIDEFQQSLQKGYAQDRVTEKKIEIVTEEEKQEFKWSINQVDNFDKLRNVYKKPQSQQNQELEKQKEEQFEYNAQIKNPKFNNIYLNTTIKRDNKYLKQGNQGQAITDSIGQLQNLKFHQYQSAQDLEIITVPKTQSQMEQIQNQLLDVHKSYIDKDLDDDNVFRQYTSEINKLGGTIDNKGNDIYAGVEQLYRQYNSNQFVESMNQIQPNFNGAIKLDFDKVKEQFKLVPQKQKQYSQQQKEQFEQFYQNIQNPLDVLHQQTDTYQQAKQVEQDLLHKQLQERSLFEIGKLPKPQFFANHYEKSKGNLKSYDAIGNRHELMKTPDKDLQKRYRYQNILSNVEDARERFKYDLNV